MVRVKILLLAVVCILGYNGLAQSEEKKERTWKLTGDDWKVTSAFSFAPGFLTENTQTIQLHGYLGMQHKGVHFRGDAFYFLGSFGDRPRFDMNHQVYCGAFYHFLNKKQFQPYVGFQPGVAIARSSEHFTLDANSNETKARIATNPVGSAIGGFTYYGQKLFFLFLEGRYIFGKHKSNSNPVFLDEMRFSFGLGLFF